MSLSGSIVIYIRVSVAIAYGMRAFVRLFLHLFTVWTIVNTEIMPEEIYRRTKNQIDEQQHDS